MNSQQAAPPELIELIQFYALRQEPLTLTIESAQHQRGWVSVSDGDVCRAETAGGKMGFEAFVEIVSWTRPTIVELVSDELDEVNLEIPLPQLLMETYWKALEHTPTDPAAEFEEVLVGLEEPTAVCEMDYGPPDGVTRAVLDVVQQLTEVNGFVSVVLLGCDTGEVVEVFGNRARFEVPPWLKMLVQSRDEGLEQVTVINEDHIDLVLRPLADDTPCFLLRVDRRVTNRALVEVAVRRARDMSETQ